MLNARGLNPTDKNTNSAFFTIAVGYDLPFFFFNLLTQTHLKSNIWILMFKLGIYGSPLLFSS